jgi:stress-induced morphogen
LYKYQYKEKSYAEDILKNGFTSNHIKHELKILVKYYKELGLKPKERKESLYDFCEKNLDGFDRVTHFKMVNSVLSYGMNKKNKLIEIESVPVTKSELTYIDSLDINHDYKKVIFTLLMLDKLNKKFHEIRNELKFHNEHYFGGTSNYRELITSSRITLKRNNLIHDIIGELDKKGIIKITGNGSIKLSFAYEIPNDSEIELNVSTFDNIGYYFDLYKNENKVKKCECCDTPIKVKSNRHKYCDKCFTEKELEKYRKYNKKRSNNE